MTNRVAFAPQDFQKMCKQAERDHEAKKLVVLMERVKRQLAERDNPAFRVESPKRPITAIDSDSSLMRVPSRTSLFER